MARLTKREGPNPGKSVTETEAPVPVAWSGTKLQKVGAAPGVCGPCFHQAVTLIESGSTSDTVDT